MSGKTSGPTLEVIWVHEIYGSSTDLVKMSASY